MLGIGRGMGCIKRRKLSVGVGESLWNVRSPKTVLRQLRKHGTACDFALVFRERSEKTKLHSVHTICIDIGRIRVHSVDTICINIGLY
jgi:hypothetical protein